MGLWSWLFGDEKPKGTGNVNTNKQMEDTVMPEPTMGGWQNTTSGTNKSDASGTTTVSPKKDPTIEPGPKGHGKGVHGD